MYTWCLIFFQVWGAHIYHAIGVKLMAESLQFTGNYEH